MKKFTLYIIIIVVIFCCFISGKTKQNNTLRFSSWGSQTETAILKNLINDFEKTSNIKIEFIHIPQNYFQKVQLLFASGLEPDVVFFNNQNIQMYIKANLLEDLSPYINKNDFYTESLNCFEKDNKIYAIPRDISNLVIFYNKDLLKNETNLKFNTIYDIAAKAVELKNKNQYGINSEEDTLFWIYFLSSNGGGILSDDKKEIIINSKESIEALKLYSDLINKTNAAPTKSQIGSMTTAQMFINGKLAMYMGGRWMVPKFRETINFDWDIAMFPASKDNKIYIDSSGWAVSKKSKHKKEAIEFIKFLSSYDSSIKLAQSGLIIPARIDASKQIIKDDTNKKPESSFIFIQTMSNSKPTPVNENYAAINDIIKDKVQSIFSGNIDAEKAFDERTMKKLKDLL